MLISDRFTDYELIGAGDGEKIERWGSVYLRRPDPQAIWPLSSELRQFKDLHATYIRSETGGGRWQMNKDMPRNWKVQYPFKAHPLSFLIEPTGFKHTGLFPEQGVNWDFCGDIIRRASSAGQEVRVLNLFAYTGAASLACAAAGASEVVHVDASKGMIARAKDNVRASRLTDRYIRFIAEDCNRFVDREIRRGRSYHGIIMDPPAYGRGPGGELWKIEDALFSLVEKCVKILDDHALFFVVNSYTTGLSAQVLNNILRLTIKPKYKGQVFAYDLGLSASQMDIVLPCGSVGRWSLIEND